MKTFTVRAYASVYFKVRADTEAAAIAKADEMIEGHTEVCPGREYTGCKIKLAELPPSKLVFALGLELVEKPR